MGLHFWDASIELDVYTFYPPRKAFISNHSVFSSWVMVVPERGEFEWQTKDVSRKAISGNAGFGDLVIVSPKMPFERSVLSESLTYHVFQWSFLSKQGKEVDVSMPLVQSPIHDTARLASVLAIVKQLQGKTDLWSLRRQAHLLEELLHLSQQARMEPAKTVDPAMQDAAELLRQRAEESFSMQEISATFGLGPVQFTRRFRAAHGSNPIEFLTQIRLGRAQRLLIETSLPLDEIAFRCGWSSGAYLSSVFHQHLLISPGKFRNKRRV